MDKMKGLVEYLAKHGNHFTERLAEKASEAMVNKDGSSHRWNAGQIEKLVSRKVYYNITSSTLGDMVYVANLAYSNFFPFVMPTRGKCIDYALAIVEDIDGYNGMPFSSWLAGLRVKNESFDFTEYI